MAYGHADESRGEEDVEYDTVITKDASELFTEKPERVREWLQLKIDDPTLAGPDVADLFVRSGSDMTHYTVTDYMKLGGE